jgi:hypothetical protein
VKETHRQDLGSVPGLSSLPIVGAMFRASNADNKERTELVLMVTPHILKENAVPYFSQGLYSNNQPAGNPNQGSIQPVALPKFIGIPTNEMLNPPADPGNATSPSSIAPPSSQQTMPLLPKDDRVLTPTTGNRSSSSKASSQGWGMSKHSKKVVHEEQPRLNRQVLANIDDLLK